MNLCGSSRSGLARAELTTLVDWTQHVFVVKHTENTSDLENALSREGFIVELIMGPYPAGSESFDGIMRCLINHMNAWRRVCEVDQPALVIEADFVPVIGFGRLPLPMPSCSKDVACFSYLYSCGPVLYGMDARGNLFGHAASTVAYALTPPTARFLLGFARRILDETDGSWQPWDSRLSVFLRHEVGVRTHFPVRQYGEHGGIPNPSHKGRVVRAWHHADVLAGRLAFSPAYARGDHFRMANHRVRAFLWAWGRLVTGRFFDPRHINKATERGRVTMAATSVLRLVLPIQVLVPLMALGVRQVADRS